LEHFLILDGVAEIKSDLADPAGNLRADTRHFVRDQTPLRSHDRRPICRLHDKHRRFQRLKLAGLGLLDGIGVRAATTSAAEAGGDDCR
jgi:hypothetical protein